MGGGAGATSGGVGFGADGLLGVSGLVATPKLQLEEGRGVPGAIESRINLGPQALARPREGE